MHWHGMPATCCAVHYMHGVCTVQIHSTSVRNQNIVLFCCSCNCSAFGILPLCDCLPFHHLSFFFLYPEAHRDLPVCHLWIAYILVTTPPLLVSYHCMYGSMTPMLSGLERKKEKSEELVFYEAYVCSANSSRGF